MIAPSLQYMRPPAPGDPFGERAALERLVALLVFVIVLAVLLKEWGLL